MDLRLSDRSHLDRLRLNLGAQRAGEHPAGGQRSGRRHGLCQKVATLGLWCSFGVICLLLVFAKLSAGRFYLLTLDKSNAVALNNIGNISLLQGRLEDAKQAYESALKLAPGEPGIMVNLARVLFQTGRQEEAKKLFREATAIDPRVLRQYGDLAASLGAVK